MGAGLGPALAQEPASSPWASSATSAVCKGTAGHIGCQQLVGAKASDDSLCSFHHALASWGLGKALFWEVGSQPQAGTQPTLALSGWETCACCMLGFPYSAETLEAAEPATPSPLTVSSGPGDQSGGLSTQELSVAM